MGEQRFRRWFVRKILRLGYSVEIKGNVEGFGGVTVNDERLGKGDCLSIRGSMSSVGIPTNHWKWDGKPSGVEITFEDE